MIADLIAIGVFSPQGYETPSARTILVPLLDVNRAPLPAPAIPPKYPDETIDYRLDWSRLVTGDAITGGSVEAISGDAAPARMVFDESTCSFFITGGSGGALCRFACKVSTQVGRTFEFILQVQIRTL